jgi:hypothetical protein
VGRSAGRAPSTAPAEVDQLRTVDDPHAARVVLVAGRAGHGPPQHPYPRIPVRRLDPAKARAPASRLEIHHTPRRGSRRNIAEIEPSRLTRQCLDRRIDDLDLLNTALAAWQAATHADQRQVDWQFTTTDARIKLRHASPTPRRSPTTFTTTDARIQLPHPYPQHSTRRCTRTPSDSVPVPVGAGTE